MLFYGAAGAKIATDAIWRRGAKNLQPKIRLFDKVLHTGTYVEAFVCPVPDLILLRWREVFEFSTWLAGDHAISRCMLRYPILR
jgi:hypothetical protein